MKENQLISHTANSSTFEEAVLTIKNRIMQTGDKRHVNVARQLELLEQLSQFDLGRFLIQHGGVNGYWTHYFLFHPRDGRISGKNNRGEAFSELERIFLDKFPIILATQQRCEIFLNENQRAVANNSKLACIPCGLMGELLYLDYQHATSVQLFGIDLDLEALDQAKNLAQERNLGAKIKLSQMDAWQLNFEDEFNLISSNGLNIYEPDEKRITELYKRFYQALVPGGKLVTSFLTYPPLFPEKTEWRMGCIDPEMLLLQRIIFADILAAKFNCYITTAQMQQLLKDIGFKNIRIIPDLANIFPTVVAEKCGK